MVVILFAGFFVLLLGAVGMLWIVSTWNRFHKLELAVELSWANYESLAKLKHEMLPDLTELVKGYAKHEIQFFEQLFIARQAASGALLAKNLSQLNMAESNLAQMMPRFNALSEAYPEVKADKHFLDLSNKLVRLEEQLADGREFYNSEATVFNIAIGILPDTIVASMKGARRRDLIDIPDYMHNDYVMSF